MIGNTNIKIHAENPSIGDSIYAFKDSPSTLTIFNIPQPIGQWKIDKVYCSVEYPDSTTLTRECTKVGSDYYTATLSGCSQTGSKKNGYRIYCSGTDEYGNTFSNLVLCVGDIKIIEKEDVL